MIKDFFLPLVCILLGTSIILEYFNISFAIPWPLLFGILAIVYGISKLTRLITKQ